MRFGKNRKNEDEEALQLENEIMSIVSEGTENGVLHENEAKMISNIFELDDKTAGDIATNRGQMVTLDVSMKIKDVLNEMLNNSFSRYPVCDGDLDHIVGILHLKDAFKAFHNMPKVNFVLEDHKEIIRQAKFVPETRVLNSLFKDMQSSKTQMVIVVDEYGQTTGLLAMEDILEEIVGNIQDEYDKDENLIVENKILKNYKISGITPLDELENTLNISFGDSNFDTINGFITDKIGHIPTKDDLCEIEYEGYIFKITEVEDKCIKTILVSAAEG